MAAAKSYTSLNLGASSRAAVSNAKCAANVTRTCEGTLVSGGDRQEGQARNCFSAGPLPTLPLWQQVGVKMEPVDWVFIAIVSLQAVANGFWVRMAGRRLDLQMERMDIQSRRITNIEEFLKPLAIQANTTGGTDANS